MSGGKDVIWRTSGQRGLPEALPQATQIALLHRCVSGSPERAGAPSHWMVAGNTINIARLAASKVTNIG